MLLQRICLHQPLLGVSHLDLTSSQFKHLVKQQKKLLTVSTYQVDSPEIFKIGFFPLS